jgi:limonene-1,2-epoxide hydrolase
MRRNGRRRLGGLVLAAAVLGAPSVRMAAADTPPNALRAATDPAEAELAATRAAVEQFKARFVTITPALAENLDRLYTEDVRFRDPVSQATGLDELRRYFTRFAEASAGARFQITDEVVQPGQAAVFWTMIMTKADGSEARRFQGVSHMKVRDRIYEERDYFDLGEAVYDHVPVVGWLTRFVRSRLD